MAEEKNPSVETTEEDLNEILRIRREKLANLTASGNDPFEKARFDRTHLAARMKGEPIHA